MRTLTSRLLKGGLIGAHRGHRARFPENTRAAFMDCPGKCDFIELDIRFSRDGIPVVYHDESLTRTSDILNQPDLSSDNNYKLEDYTMAELQCLDIGSWYYKSDPFGEIGNGNVCVPDPLQQRQTLLTLDEVLLMVKKAGLGINVEIKALHSEKNNSVRELADKLRSSGWLNQILVSSFDHTILTLLKDELPELQIAALADSSEHHDGLASYLEKLGADGYHIIDHLADQELINQLKNNGFFTGIYTVNDKARKRQLLRMGAGSVITDYLE